MPIEKAFAIDAAPARIYDALEEELREAEASGGEGFAVVRKDPPKAIDLRVTIAGVPCWLTYRLVPRDTATEVVALLQPFGWRYTFFRIITFGMRDQGFEVALVQGLANLKAAVEGRDFPDEADLPAVASDE